MTNILNALFILSVIIAETSTNVPGCDYFDTVDLKDSTHFENGSYQYRNVLIPKEKVGKFKYRLNREGVHRPVSNYARGCICHVKSCIHLCCDPDKFPEDFLSNITLHNGTEIEVNIFQEFVVLPGFKEPCDLFNVTSNVDDKWTLFENGILLSHDRNQNLHKRDYCLVPFKVSDDNYKLVPHYFEYSSEAIKNTITIPDALRVVSVFCMLITIATFLYLPQFRSVYNKCCICYFICLTVSFSLLWAETLNRENITPRSKCYVLGYSGYYAVMATFLWLLMINFTLWKTFKNLGIMYRSSFKKYNLFVWSVAAGLLVVTGLAEYLIEVEEWQPGVSIYYCWVKTEDWSAMIYYYGPILLAILINLWLSIATARTIYREDKDNSREWTNSDSNKYANNQANFGMFFRLFAVTGVVWILDIIAYVSAIKVTQIALLIDIVTSAQGVLLFFVTILRKDVLKSLYERMESGNKKPIDQNLTSTNETPESITDSS